MCGRFYLFFDDDGKQTRLYHKVSELSVAYAQKEIYPSQHALVLIEGNYEYNVSVMKWGISSYKGSLLINARSEGIHEKKTFIPMLSKRCLIQIGRAFEKQIYIQYVVQSYQRQCSSDTLSVARTTCGNL